MILSFLRRLSAGLIAAAGFFSSPHAFAFNPNTDGETDLLWHLNNGYANYAWWMNAVTYITANALNNSSPTNWQAVATADFNRDGQTDILWRDKGSGQNAVWFMTNSVIASTGLITTGDTNFYVVGTGDFNHDGLVDILWHHNSADQTVAWLMGNPNGTNYTGNGWCPTNSDTNWKAVATGDFNNDSSADIVWRNTSDGANMVWLMSGTNRTATGMMLSETNLSTQLVATGRFNREGHTDLVWRSASGVNAIWLIGGTDGTNFLSSHATETVTNADWVIGGTGAYTNTMALAADVDAANSKITVKWQPGMTTLTTVKRKQPSDSSWTTLQTSYAPFSYTNLSMTAGQRYEFDVGGNTYYAQADNRAGDGKFDDDYLPANQAGNALQLAVGRIDFANLPAFSSKTETQLLSQYFNKDHRYRAAQISFNDTASVIGLFSLPNTNSYDHRNDHTFHNARRNGTRWLGTAPGKLVHGDIFNQTTNPFLFGFISGSGNIATIAGDGAPFTHTTYDLADPSKEPKAGFYFLHGSWFADWNLTTNNLARACLGTTNYGLGAVAISQADFLLSFEMLALGEPFANGLLRTCVGVGNYVVPRWFTFLGDPTLRLKMPAPASNLSASGSNPVSLTWNAAPGSPVSYFVYRSTNGIDGNWTRIATTTSTSYSHSSISGAMYQVRAAVITTSGSGSYTNLSQGMFVNTN